MAAVTAPGRVDRPAGNPPRGKRRWVLGAVVAVWILVVSGLAVWSVGHEEPTVPEQRDIRLAVPDLQRAAGVVYTAATGDGRAVVLGALDFEHDCRVTPVRSGLIATRAITVHVPSGEAVEATEAIAAALPPGYAADVGRSRGGTRVSLHADAGNFIGIDMSTESSAPTLTLRLSTGCRPFGDGGTPSTAGPAAPAAPALLTQTLSALGARSRTPETRTVACPSGAAAASYEVDGVRTPPGLAVRLGRLTGGAEVVRDDETARAYRTRGGESMVIQSDGPDLRVVVSTACQ